MKNVYFESLISDVDIDNNGFIDIDEFTAFMMKDINDLGFYTKGAIDSVKFPILILPTITFFRLNYLRKSLLMI